MLTHICRVGQNARTIYIRCIYGIFGREITNYTVIYGAYIRFWPTLHICICTHVFTHTHMYVRGRRQIHTYTYTHVPGALCVT